MAHRAVCGKPQHNVANEHEVQIGKNEAPSPQLSQRVQVAGHEEAQQVRREDVGEAQAFHQEVALHSHHSPHTIEDGGHAHHEQRPDDSQVSDEQEVATPALRRQPVQQVDESEDEKEGGVGELGVAVEQEKHSRQKRRAQALGVSAGLDQEQHVERYPLRAQDVELTEGGIDEAVGREGVD